ncbi:MAG: amidohydrolase family protein [Enhygromyxa sp.]
MRKFHWLPTTTLLSCAMLLGASACSDDAGNDGDTGDGDTGDSDTGDGDGDTGDGDGDTGDGDHELPEVVDCRTNLQPPADGSVCTAEGQAGGSLLIHGDVLTPETVFLGGTVAVEGGVITCAGCDCAADPAAFDATITCADAVITPGLINTHDHITYAHNWPIGEGVDRYEHRHDWRTGQNGHAPLPYSGNAPADAVVAAELRFVMGGATSTASAGGRWGLLRNVDTNDNGGLPIKPVDSDTFPFDDANGKQQVGSCEYGRNPTNEGYIAGLDAYLPHIGEGIDQYAQNELHCAAFSRDLFEPKTGIVHATGATLDEVLEIAASKAQVVWSPRSNVVLYGSTAPVTLMDRLGVNIALGTDWMPSGSMNMLRELACAEYLDEVHFNDHFSDKQLWEMVTTNAAFAIGAHTGLGMIKPGYVADLAIFAKGDEQLHGAVVRGHETRVALVMRGGEPLYGDAALLDSPAIGGSACEELDVCGVAKRACVEADTTTTLAAVMAAAEYPLWFCPGEVPVDEPTCVPWREVEFPDGVTDNDQDGDGLSDDLDLCPNVFSPLFTTGVVPLWDEQPDADLDGIGDVCDPTPCADCVPMAANDFDQDGVPNGVDNCPYVPNPDQADADGDGHGDVCDGCADPNPGFLACATTIEALADESHPDHPVPGTKVTIVDAYVTAVRPSDAGFWVETGTQEPYTGLAVFSGGTQPSLQVGDVVTVSGVYEEYYGLVQITSPTVTILDSGAPLPFEPLVVDPAAIATGGALAEPYEAMLLQVDGVAITNVNPDAPDDFDEFVVTGNLRVNDFNFAALDNTCPLGSSFESIVGTLNYGFNNTKLEPRGPDDVAWVDCQPW